MAATNTKPSWALILEITDRGNNAEVKRNKDGELDVFEVRKRKLS